MEIDPTDGENSSTSPMAGGPGEGWHRVDGESFDSRYHDGIRWTSWVSVGGEVRELGAPESEPESDGSAHQREDTSTLVFLGIWGVGWLLILIGLFAGVGVLAIVGLVAVLAAALRWRTVYRHEFAARVGGTAGQRATAATKNLAKGAASNAVSKAKVRRAQNKNAMKFSQRYVGSDGAAYYSDGTPVATLSGGTPGGGAFAGSGDRLARSFRRSVLWTLKCATILPFRDGVRELRQRSANSSAGTASADEVPRAENTDET